MNTPNLLTIFRLLLSPLFMVLYCSEELFGFPQELVPFLLLLFLTISESTDAIDGYLARRFKLVSDFGKIFDPITDSISRITLYVAFTLPPIKLPLWIVLAFFYRDSLIGGLRILCALRGEALGARATGKIKAIVHSFSLYAIVILMIPYAYGALDIESLQSYSALLAGMSAVISLLSGAEYLYCYRRTLKESQQILS